MAEFTALTVAPEALPADPRQERGIIGLANPAAARDSIANPPTVGTYQLSSYGDFAPDASPEASLRKRMLRRALGGDFFHLPGYSAQLLARIKRLARPSEIRQLQLSLQQKVALEPDVRSCTVAARLIDGALWLVLSAVPTWASSPVVVSVKVP